MSMIGFPLLLIPLAIYNIIVFLMPGTPLAASLFAVPLMSGTVWSVTLGDLLLGIGILMLMFEVMKAARPPGKFFTDHLLALIVLGGAVAEFVLLPPFGNSTFALLCIMAMVDFLTGISLRARRARPASAITVARDDVPSDRIRSLAAEAPVPQNARSASRIEPKIAPKLEPQAEPARIEPAGPETSAAPLAESILSDRSAPMTTSPSPPTQPASAEQPATTQIDSPGLQPATHNETPPR